MRLIEAAAQIDRVVRARGVEVEFVEYEVASDRTSVVCRVNFAAGPPLVLVIELSAPTTPETLPRDALSALLVPSPAVH